MNFKSLLKKSNISQALSGGVQRQDVGNLSDRGKELPQKYSMLQGLSINLQRPGVEIESLITNQNFSGELIKGLTFINKVFKGCDFSNGQFSDATFEGCVFDGCNLDGVTLDHVNMNGCTLDDCNAPVYLDTLDCSKVLWYETISVPCASTTFTTGGQLNSGVYQVLFSYATSKGQNLTSFLSATSPIPLFTQKVAESTQYDTNSALVIDISNIKTGSKYQFINII